jgi:hypothetical protein
MRKSLVVVYAIVLMAIQSGCAQASLGLQVKDGHFYKEGQPYRGVGANYFDLLRRVMREPTNTTSLDGLERLSKAGILLEKYGSLDKDTLTAINDTADKLSDVETGWDEYAAITGNRDKETGGIPSILSLRDLSPQEVNDIYSARVAEYQSKNPVMGLESTFLDPVDIVAGKFAAGAILGKTALGAFSTKLPAGVGNATKTGVWRLTSVGSDKVMIHNKFGKFFRSKSDGLWWVEDTAGHGGSAFKVYRETGKGLVWYRDADQFGNFILLKHKSDVGTFLPWKEMAGVK